MTKKTYLPDRWDLIRLQSAVADVLPLAVAVVSQEYKMLWANEAFWTMIGGPQRVTNGDLLSAVPFPSNEDMERALTYVKVSHEPFRNPDLFLHCPADDADHYIDVTVLPLDLDGQPPSILIVAMDVTEQSLFRRQLEEVATEADRQRRQIDLLMKNARVGVVFYNLDLRIMRINSYLSHVSSREPEEMVGHRLEDMVPSVAGQLIPHLRRVLSEGVTIQEVEIRGDMPDEPGRVRTWLSTFFPVTLADGRIVGAGEIVMEITERKKEEQLRQQLLEEVQRSRDMLQGLLETIPAGVLVADANGNFTLVNQAAVKWFKGRPIGDAFSTATGYTLHRLDGSPMPADELPLAKALRYRAATDNADILTRLDDGSEIVLQCSARPIVDASGRTTAAIVVFLDVTERRMAEEHLRELTASLQALLEACPLPVVAMDCAGNVIRWCPSAERLFGWKREEVLGKPAPHIAPEHQEETARLQDEIINRGKDLVVGKVTRQTKDGHTLELMAWVSPVKDEHGTVTGTLGVFAPIVPLWPNAAP